jgi:hypothetical protein
MPSTLPPMTWPFTPDTKMKLLALHAMVPGGDGSGGWGGRGGGLGGMGGGDGDGVHEGGFTPV